MKQRHEIYANDKLWNKTSCPFETEVLNLEGYDISMGELWDLEDELSAAKIEFTKSKKGLFIDFSWDEDDIGSEHLVKSIIYGYKGYVYHVKMCYTQGIPFFTMTREPQFNKKHL